MMVAWPICERWIPKRLWARTVLLAYCIVSQDIDVEDCLHLDVQVLVLIRSFRNMNLPPHARTHPHKNKETMVKRDEGSGNRNLTEDTGEKRGDAWVHSGSLEKGRNSCWFVRHLISGEIHSVRTRSTLNLSYSCSQYFLIEYKWHCAINYTLWNNFGVIPSTAQHGLKSKCTSPLSTNLFPLGDSSHTQPHPLLFKLP